jgi:hypothetical protein
VRILLDECLPRPLIRLITGHDAKTVPEMGWAGKSNGELMALMTGLFDAFLTVDRNLVFSQNLSGLKIGVVVLHASSNRLEDLQPLVPQVLEVLRAIRSGQIIHVGAG